jgi:hypothetical protein
MVFGGGQNEHGALRDYPLLRLTDHLLAQSQECRHSPRLEEIADHFGVKAPTAHKLLEALQRKRYLYFGRTSTSGFFIRLIERAGSPETMVEITVAGKIDRYGEVFDFPQKLGYFSSVLIGSKPEDLFALVVLEDIPQSSMLAACRRDSDISDTNCPTGQKRPLITA